MKCSGSPTQQHIIHLQENIVEFFLDNPSRSARRVAMQMGVRKSDIGRELKTEELHPYHFQNVQALLPEDKPRRLRFQTRLRKMRISSL